MISQQTLKGNLVLQDYTTAFTLNQGDKGVPFRIELLENGTSYTLLSTDTVSIEWLKPNGKPFLQDGDIIYGTNYIEIITPEAVAQYSGSGTFNIIISDGTVRKGTIRREYKVVPTSMKPGSISEDVITDAITELRELNSTLAATIQTGNLDNYAKKTYVNKEVELINSSLEEKANKNDVASTYAKKTEVNDLVSSKVDQSDYDITKTNVYKNTLNIASQNARIDRFTNLAEGSTTGDAELIDGRVDADGTTYSNIGGAIRGQYTKNKEKIYDILDTIDVGGSFVQDSLTYQFGKRYLAADSNIGSEISQSSSQGYYACAEVTVNNSKYKVSLYATNDSLYHVIYLDADNKMISGELMGTSIYARYTDYELTIPDGCEKILFNSHYAESEDTSLFSIKKYENYTLASENYVDKKLYNTSQNVVNSNFDYVYSNPSNENIDGKICSMLNSIEFNKVLTPRVPATTKFSHGGETVKVGDYFYLYTAANDTNNEDHIGSEYLYASLSKISGDFSNATVDRYVIANKDTIDSDGHGISSGVGAGIIKAIGTTLHLMFTAKCSNDSKIYLYHTTFNTETETIGTPKKCTLDSNAFSSEYASSLSGRSDNEAVCINGGVGNNNGTYYCGIAIGNKSINGIVVSTTDFINYTKVCIPDLTDSALEYEMAVAFLNNNIYCALRQATGNRQTLLKLNATTGAVIDKYDLPDGRSKACFYIYNNELFLIHSLLNRKYVEIVKINTSSLSSSVSLMVSASGNVYPSVLVVDDKLYLTSTRNNCTKVYISEMKQPSITNETVYKIFGTLLTLIQGN